LIKKSHLWYEKDAEIQPRGETIDIKNHTTQAITAVVENLPIGTNLALYQFLWMLISGSLHNSRGAMFPALKSIGLTDEEVRRSWSAMRYGSWRTERLLEAWQTHVTAQGEWQASQYAGYYTKAVDITAYWRPALKRIKSKHYDAEANKALPAVVLGMVGRVGRVGQQRMALLTDLVRADLTDASKTAIQTKLLQRTSQHLAKDEMPVIDAGIKLTALFQAGLERFVLRLATNFTARRNFLPEYEGGRPSEYGDIVRPLPRTYDGNHIPATAPDRIETWQHLGRNFRAEFWDNLVLRENKVSAKNQTVTVVAIDDPRFENPWLLACPLQLSGADFWGFYHDRWPIEQLPLASKHMVGSQRQFVSAEESCFRLPELSLLAGSMLTYLAATLPPIPTGFWDRTPKGTPGRLRRWLGRTTFSDLQPRQSSRIRKKASVSHHLPKGVLGHRRSKQPALT
jgi:hypothetical protein